MPIPSKQGLATLLSIFGLALLAPSTAAAADTWKQTFSGAAAGLELVGLKVLVLAGNSGEESDSASTALADALRGKDRAALVLDASTVGKQAGQTDPKILEKTQKAPVDQRLIVRVFQGEPPTVVVSIYDKTGTLLAAHSGQKGKAIFSAKVSGFGGLGLKGTAADDTVEKVTSMDQDRNTAIEEYSKRFLWVGGFSIMQGKYQKRLTLRQLYGLLDDDALNKRVAEKKADTRHGQITAVGIGTVVFVLSAAATGWGSWKMATAQHSDDMFVIGMLVGSFGAAAVLTEFIVGAAFVLPVLLSGDEDDPGVFKSGELREHIEKYNAQLRTELGLEGVAGLPTGI